MAILGVFAWLAIAPAAQAETRTLKLYFTHTRERAEITYKRNGRYLQDGLNQINRFLRDWRRNESTKMDPRLLDLLWETYRATGARDYIHVVSAYRSPATNEMLRKRSSGVASKSQHMLGKAIDFYIPGVKLADLRRVALSLHGGGVGYYPKSGSPFVHLDVGSVRHWPRMNRQQLMAMFPDGKTLHVPSDGKPLPGYQQALAAYNSRSRGGASVTVASAAATERPKKGGGFLAAFFRGGSDREEDEAESQVATRTPQRSAPVASTPPPPAPEPVVETPAIIIASLPAASVPLPHFAPRANAAASPQPDIASVIAEAEAAEESPVLTASAGEIALDVPYPTPRPADAPGLQAIAAVMTEGSSGLDEAQAILAMTDGSSPAIPSELSFVPQPAPRVSGEIPAILTALAPVEPVAPRQAAIQRSESKGLSSEIVRQHVVASLEAPDGRRPLDVSARTTAKAQRPAPEDARGHRRPQIVPMPRHLTQRAFAPASITAMVTETKAPSFSFTPNHAAPREVYTAGFQQEPASINPNRFTGSAVTFLSIARFN